MSWHGYLIRSPLISILIPVYEEDKIDEDGKRIEPWYKSDWNPDLLLSFNYVMHFVLYRRRLFEQVDGVRKAYEGSQDYDLLLRASERTDRIFHIPQIHYHWRMGKGFGGCAHRATPDGPGYAGLFRQRWQPMIDRDPYFNPNFLRSLECFAVPE